MSLVRMPKRTVAKIPLRDAVETYLAQSVDEGLSPTSASNYRAGLKWIVDKHGDCALQDLHPVQIDGAYRIATKNASVSVRARESRQWNIFQNWAVKMGLLRGQVIKLRVPIINRRTRLIDEQEFKRLLATSNPSMALILRALHLTGARPAELCKAQIGDWQNRDGDGFIQVGDHKTSKATGEPRVIPVSDELKPILIDAIGDRMGHPDDVIFRTSRGKRWDAAYLSHCFTKNRKRAKIPRGVVLLSIRHTVATALAGEDLELARIVLGHRDIRSTSRYVHKSQGEVNKRCHELLRGMGAARQVDSEKQAEYRRAWNSLGWFLCDECLLCTRHQDGKSVRRSGIKWACNCVTDSKEIGVKEMMDNPAYLAKACELSGLTVDYSLFGG